MPRELVLLAGHPIDGDAVVAAVCVAVRGLEAQPVLGGGAVQLTQAGRVVLTLVRPRLVEVVSEATRLLPGERVPPGDRLWWLEVVIAPDADPVTVTTVVDALRSAVPA